MEKNRAMQEIVKYREKLIQYGKVIAEENPDHLNADELQALVYRIFDELKKLNVRLGHSYHDVGMSMPESVTKERAEELFINFIDNYNIIYTPTNRIYNYIVENYSLERYPKILCVESSENLHLGRKLEKKGYNVVSVNPEVSKIFPEKIQNVVQQNASAYEKFHIAKEGNNKSEDIIEWANLVVGNKATKCAENLISIGKPAVFNISKNAEIYNIKFKGVPITSSKVLAYELSKCSGVSVKRDNMEGLNEEDLIFVCNGRERVDDSR